MNEKYRLMIYFAHTTLCIYAKTIKCERDMTFDEFREENHAVIERVCEEAITIFNYELSYNQIQAAINVYFQTKFNPSSVEETTSYKPK